MTYNIGGKGPGDSMNHLDKLVDTIKTKGTPDVLFLQECREKEARKLSKNYGN